MPEPVIVAVVSDYEGLIDALRTHRKNLGLSQEAVDDLAGLQSGYTGKLEVGPAKGRGLGRVSLPRLLHGLGLKLALLRGDNACEVEEFAREEAAVARHRNAIRRAA